LVEVKEIDVFATIRTTEVFSYANPFENFYQSITILLISST